MRKSDARVLLVALAIPVVVVVFIFGWVLNILAIMHATSYNGLLIVRIIGVFIAPLGGILGYV